MVTIASMRTSYGFNRYGSLSEYDFLCQSNTGPDSKPGLIIAHPRASSATGMFSDPTWVRLYQDLCEKYIVSVSDCGGSVPWGNSSTTTAITAIRDQLIAAGATGTKVGLLGISMGGLAVFNWAKANPTLTAFVCGMVPALNLADLKTVSAGAYGSEIDTAYGGSYTDASQGSTRSPWYYRGGWPGTIRTGIWYSPVDTICRPQWPADFKAAQGGTDNVELFAVADASGASPDHATSVPPTIEGNPSGPYAFPKPADWCNQRRYDTAF